MDLALIAVAAVGGAIVGFFAKGAYTQRTLGSAEAEAKKKLEDSKTKAKELILAAKEEADKIKDEARKEDKDRRKELLEFEKRLEKRQESIDKKLDDLDERSEKLRKSEAELEKLKDTVRDIKEQQQEKLQKVAGLNKEEAKEKLLKMTEKDIKEDLTKLIAKKRKDAKEHAEEDAQRILTTAMERLASDVTAEKTHTAVKLPDDDMKGRVIGKEGRNIQAFERITGVDVLIDESPGMVVISSFDPVRREVARRALAKLIKDGRIHPGRIEEVIAKVQKNLNKEVIETGEEAMREVGVVGLPKQIIQWIGELKFRTSYGQNVLKHSTEMTHLAGMIAEEVGADVRVTKTATFIHDLGKALTHKIEGKHHHISGEMARKYGLSEEVAHAAEAHHEDIEATTPEASIVRAVDALSAARPGARNQSTENFIERMKDLENTATSFKGVNKAYAVSAGREIRIFVNAEDVDDLSSIRLARDIATKIESTLQYPGTIKVNVIRETRAVEYAK